MSVKMREWHCLPIQKINMITGKEYKKINKRYRNGSTNSCDRCGNDLSQGQPTILHFPAIQTYIELCGLCNYGLLLGFHADFKLLQKELNKHE